MNNNSKTSIFAPAKINLFLHLRGVRNDGYHKLQTLVSFADIGDVIEIKQAERFYFDIDGPYAHMLEADENGYDNNMVIKAAQGLAQIVGRDLNVNIRLTKNLPIASGLGGGSADAAAAIWGLQEYWGLSRSTPYLWPLLTKLGADLPMCLHCQSVVAEGIGEELGEPVLMPEIPVLLVNPLQKCSTSEVFLRSSRKAFKDKIDVPAGFSSIFELAAFLRKCDNDLFDDAAIILPEIKNVIIALETQKNSLLTRMSGSGASCFAIFETLKEAKTAAKSILKDNPGWWVRAGLLNRPERY